MKKTVLLWIVCSLCLLMTGISMAAEKPVKVPENPYDWSISMQPPATEAEKEEARWSLILENDLGIYAYDMSTLRYMTDKKKNVDENRIGVTVKTLFTNKDLSKNLQKQYADKLQGREKVLYCLLDMEYNMTEKTYTVKEMQVFTDKNRMIESKKNKTGFVPVPEKTFAEALYEICQKYTTENNADGATRPSEGTAGDKAS